MSENPNVERAAKVLKKFMLPCDTTTLEGAAAKAVAHLLVTPLHERALEACERIASRAASHVHPDCTDQPEAVRVGRESLALKEKAKGAKRGDEWGYFGEARNGGPLRWFVGPMNSTAAKIGPFTESQARRVAAALNEGDES